MKGSIAIIIFFGLGVLLGTSDYVPEFFISNSDTFSTYALYVLMMLVGVGVGSDNNAIQSMRKMNLKSLLIPISVVVGSLVGALVIYPFLNNMSLADVLAVSAGFGYYSLSSIYITKLSGEYLGMIALTSNIIREIFTLVGAPLFTLLFGKLASIAAGGATSMDTTLPIIIKSSGKEWAIYAVFSGIVLTVLVPFLIEFIYWIVK